MRKMTVVLLGLAILAGVSAMNAEAADASVSLDVASAYVFRGATFNDGLVVQPGLSVTAGSVELGVWGNLDLDDYDGAVEDGEFQEVDLFASYALPIKAVAASIGYTEYLYPSAGGDADREVALSVGLKTILAPSLTVAYGLGGAIESSLYAELGIGHEEELGDEENPVTVSAKATLGYVEPDEGDSGFSHYTVSLGVSYGMVSAGVTYIGEMDDDVLMVDTDVVGTIGVGYDF